MIKLAIVAAAVVAVTQASFQDARPGLRWAIFAIIVFAILVLRGLWVLAARGGQSRQQRPRSYSYPVPGRRSGRR